MSPSPQRRVLSAIAAVAAGTLVLSACASQRSDETATSAGDVDSTFVFGASADPVSLDPAFASDGESFRVSRQIFEGLVGVETGGTAPVPQLATEWTQSDDGLEYTFTLREGVTFHDGTAFDAEAVCYNFDRQSNFTGVAQSDAAAYYWGKIMRGFADSGTSIYVGCEATSATEAVISLNTPFAGFIPSLSLPAFAIQSPTALAEYDADVVSGTADAPQLSEYATAHPTGTGPFVFDSWEPGQEVVLTANADYWGEQGQVQKIIFRTLGDSTARRQALESGAIDGYDLVAPADLGALGDGGYTLETRDPFTVLYLAFNQAQPELADPRVREALTMAIDREQLVTQVLQEGTEVGTQFMPSNVIGWNADVPTYDYDVDAAKALLAEAGFTEENPLTLTFNYPVNVSRPYMPNPEQIFANISSQLEAVGVVVEPVSNEWGEYLDLILGGSDHGIHLLGWNGDYNDPDNFVGTFFGTESAEWGFNNPELFEALNAARGAITPEEQAAAYEAVNAQIMEFLPGIPLAHPASTLAFSPRVDSYPASPVQDEVFNLIVLTK